MTDEETWKQRALRAECKARKLESILLSTTRQIKGAIRDAGDKLSSISLPDGWEFGDRSSNWFDLKLNSNPDLRITVMRYSGKVSSTDRLGDIQEHGKIDTMCPDDEMAIEAIRMFEGTRKDG